MENTENSGLLEEEDLDDIVEKTTSRVKVIFLLMKQNIISKLILLKLFN